MASGKITRADRVALSALLFGGVLLAASRFNDMLGLTGDNAVYLLLARNLVAGQPYDNAGFPWGYPALLVPGVALFGPENLIEAVPWLKLITVAGFLLSLLLLYLLFRLRHPALLAAGAVGLFAINDISLVYTNDLMTELPYVAAVAIALLFWFRRIQPPAEEGWTTADERAAGISWRDLLLAAVLLAIPYYLRTVGLALLAAAPLSLALRRRWREGLLLGGMLAILAAPWALFSTLTDPQRNYTASLLMRDPYQPEAGRIADAGEFAWRLGDTAQLYATQVFPLMLLPGIQPGWYQLIWPVLLLAVLAGFLLRLARRVEITEIYVAAFVFILLAWPWRGDRFLLPVLPFMLHYMMEALAGVYRVVRGQGAGGREQLDDTRASPPVSRLPSPVSRLLAPAARLLAVLLLLVLALPNLAVDARAAQLNARYWQGDPAGSGLDSEWQMFFAASRWAGEHTPPGSVILSRKSSLTEIYAGRPSELIPLIAPEEYPRWLAERNVSYIVEDAFSWSTHTINYLRPAMQREPEMYRLVYATEPPVTRVWEVVRMAGN